MLCRAVGTAETTRMLEVFFGARPFDQETRRREDGLTYEAIIEVGGTLRYYRQDNDRIVVFIHPPIPRYVDCPHQFYVLDLIGNRPKLRSSDTLKRHLRYLLAMMEVHSVDGVPTFRDRCRVLWLTRTKIRIAAPEPAPASTDEGEGFSMQRLIGERPIETTAFSILNSSISGWIPAIFTLVVGWLLGRHSN
jgi:hypothetical protein